MNSDLPHRKLTSEIFTQYIVNFAADGRGELNRFTPGFLTGRKYHTMEREGRGRWDVLSDTVAVQMAAEQQSKHKVFEQKPLNF